MRPFSISEYYLKCIRTLTVLNDCFKKVRRVCFGAGDLIFGTSLILRTIWKSMLGFILGHVPQGIRSRIDCRETRFIRYFNLTASVLSVFTVYLQLLIMFESLQFLHLTTALLVIKCFFKWRFIVIRFW